MPAFGTVFGTAGSAAVGLPADGTYTIAVFSSSASPVTYNINVSATAINVPAKGVGIYAATKAAVAMLTQTLAVEAGPSGVRVNTIAPGFTVTSFVGGHLRDAAGNIISGTGGCFSFFIARNNSKGNKGCT